MKKLAKKCELSIFEKKERKNFYKHLMPLDGYLGKYFIFSLKGNKINEIIFVFFLNKKSKLFFTKIETAVRLDSMHII